VSVPAIALMKILRADHRGYTFRKTSLVGTGDGSTLREVILYCVHLLETIAIARPYVILLHVFAHKLHGDGAPAAIGILLRVIAD
jgi:hypothetical protein